MKGPKSGLRLKFETSGSDNQHYFPESTDSRNFIKMILRFA